MVRRSTLEKVQKQFPHIGGAEIKKETYNTDNVSSVAFSNDGVKVEVVLGPGPGKWKSICFMSEPKINGKYHYTCLTVEQKNDPIEVTTTYNQIVMLDVPNPHMPIYWVFNGKITNGLPDGLGTLTKKSTKDTLREYTGVFDGFTSFKKTDGKEVEDDNVETVITDKKFPMGNLLDVVKELFPKILEDIKTIPSDKKIILVQYNINGVWENRTRNLVHENELELGINKSGSFGAF